VWFEEWQAVAAAALALESLALAALYASYSVAFGTSARNRMARGKRCR
jgi:hypothetical protein